MAQAFEKFIERIAGSLFAMIGIVYISGFIVVNAYLSKFHIVQIEVFQPAFISAGLLFTLLLGIAFVAVWPISMLITKILSALNSKIKPRPTTGGTTGQITIYRATFENIGWSILTFAVISSLIYLGYGLEKIAGERLLMVMIRWSSRGSSAESMAILTPYVVKIARLQGLVAIPLFLIYQNRSKIGTVTKELAIVFCIIAFLMVQAFSLLIVADKVYGHIPSTIGGGQPEYIIFYVTPENASRLDSLDDTFTDNEAIIPKYTRGTNSSIIATNQLTLFWQIKSFGMRSQEQEEVYFVRPSICPNCPVIKVYGSSVFSVAYKGP